MAAPMSARKAFGNVSNVTLKPTTTFKPTVAFGSSSIMKPSLSLGHGKLFNENVDDLDICGDVKISSSPVKRTTKSKAFDPVEEMIFPEAAEHCQNMTGGLFEFDTESVKFDEEMPAYLQRTKPRFDMDWL